MTDCAICFEELTAATGRSVMSCGHEFHMRCLVQWLQKPDGTGNCPCCRAEPSEMERLVAPPVDSDDEENSDDESEGEETTGITPLMEATRNGFPSEVQRLLDQGADIEAADSDGDTALVYAMIHNEDECAKILLSAGACMNTLSWHAVEEAVSDKTSAALLAACAYNSLPIVRAALVRGANPNYAHPATGVTPLMEIVRSDGDLEIVDLLITKKADVRAIDKGGWNVFMWFAEGSGDIDIMASLLTAAGPIMCPRSDHIKAARKIQAFWRGRLHLRAAATLVFMHLAKPEPPTWFMHRMMNVV